MAPSQHIVFGAPGRYLQGPGALDKLGGALAQCGASAAVVGDPFVTELLAGQILRSCTSAGVTLRFLPVASEITHEAIRGLIGALDGDSVDVVVGLGGGKAIDAGKAVAHALNTHFISAPTVASTDAPASKNYVIYSADHELLEVGHLENSPRFVIVDTTILGTAPVRLLRAGIGDAITKVFEAEQCRKAAGANMFGAPPSLAALALARECYATVRRHAELVLVDGADSKAGPEFEELIEAVLLMSAVGFESGGLSIAHAMTRGLGCVCGVRDAPHGFQVAYGLLVQLVLERRSAEFMADMLQFYQRIGLPLTLTGLAGRNIDDTDWIAIAGPTLEAPHARNFERSLVADDLLAAMRQVEQLSEAA